MTETVITSDCAIDNICVMDNYVRPVRRTEAEVNSKRLAEMSKLAESIAGQLKNFTQQALAEYKQQIAELAVKIADKIICSKVDTDDYNLAEIITEAINYAPKSEAVTVYLNAEDLKKISELQASGELWGFPSIEFKAQIGIGKGQCKVETAKGSVNYIFKEHLERIENVLKQAIRK